MDLSLYSTVQIARGGSITSDNNNSEVIRINDITKYQGGVDESPLIGPLYASAATGISPSGFVAGTLPAHIKNFTAHKKQNEIWIGWSSAEETGVAYYDLQRSLDGISWMNLKTVAAKGPGSFYEEKDDKPLKGTNLYRLKMHGTNGTASYSGIVLSAFMMPLEILSAVHKGNLLQVQLSEAGTKPLLLQLIEPNGNIIRQSIQDPGSALLFPIDGVQQGIYILSVSDQAGHTTSKKLMLL